MKAFSQVEPRIAIDATNTPGDEDSVFKISQPGSYYLAANMTGEAGKNGIEVAASGVTIDLCGFTLTGVSGSWHGVAADSSRAALAVRNGVLLSWGGNGVQAGAAPAVMVEGLRVLNNGGEGIAVGPRSVVTDCIATENHTGIEAGPHSTVSRCTARLSIQDEFAFGSGVAATECVAEGNGGFGFSGGGTLSARVSSSNSSGFFGAGVFDACVAESNETDGFYVTGAGVVTGCASKRNGRHRRLGGNHHHGLQRRRQRESRHLHRRGRDSDRLLLPVEHGDGHLGLPRRHDPRLHRVPEPGRRHQRAPGLPGRREQLLQQQRRVERRHPGRGVGEPD